MTLLTAADTDRFWRRAIKGPGERDCWIWTGAIADDGYGRFWIRTNGKQRVLRPHRVAFSLATGVDVDDLPVVEHFVCDNPICVRAAGDRYDHLAGGTQADNIARMSNRGRGGGTPLIVREAGVGRRELATRSRALRDAVSDGWNPERIEAALHAGATPRLW